mmetsp:Transcript_137469/g.439212  ORF Transcript_137469/g.439212 Transcript_137469/m.439212 type:complete len:239 (-) Transcript_137469:7129-7845(-)
MLCAVAGEAHDVREEQRHVLVVVGKAEVPGLHLGQDLPGQHAVQQLTHALVLLANGLVLDVGSPRVPHLRDQVHHEQEDGAACTLEQEVGLACDRALDAYIAQRADDDDEAEEQRHDAVGAQTAEVHQDHEEEETFEHHPKHPLLLCSAEVGGQDVRDECTHKSYKHDDRDDVCERFGDKRRRPLPPELPLADVVQHHGGHAPNNHEAASGPDRRLHPALPHLAKLRVMRRHHTQRLR